MIIIRKIGNTNVHSIGSSGVDDPCIVSTCDVAPSEGTLTGASEGTLTGEVGPKGRQQERWPHPKGH